MLETIIKRSGKVEAFDPDKLNELGEWAVENTECSWPLLVTKAVKKLYDGCTTKELMKAMIDTAGDMIEEDFDWQYPAAKLTIADIRKDVFASFEPPSLWDFYSEITYLGRWRPLDYTKEEIQYLDTIIDHNKDENFSFAGIRQVINKYLVQNVNTKELYETPQFMYMGVAMAMFESTEDKDVRLQEVVDAYHNFSDWVNNVPTPILRGLRTFTTGFASCCLVEAWDTLDSIDTAEHAVFKMTANGAGIGYCLQSRSVGDTIRQGQVVHGGKLPYYRHIDRSVKGNVQAGRGGSATVHYVCFDPEIEILLKLKSDKVSEAVRIKHMDYSMLYNKYLLKRMAKGETIPLFSLQQAPEVHRAFYDKNLDNFIRLYEEAESKYPDAPRLNGLEAVFKTNQKQAVETGRIYAMDVHEVNRRSTFKEPVVMSNLCQEIVQPTGGYSHVTDLYKTEEVYSPDGKTSEISLCTLSAHNIDLTARMSNEELERVCYLTVKGLDNLIDYQSYPFPNMEMTAKARRNLGIGITNVAGALANRYLPWDSEEARTWVHEQVERLSFFIHKASIQLAKERGACDWYDRTTYSDGILPIDNYVKAVDELHTTGLNMPWEEEIRKPLMKYGIRNSVLEAEMPAESSSVACNTTNGGEPIRKLVVAKKTEQGITKFVAPYAKDMGWMYQKAWDIPMKSHIGLMAIIQKFYGQSISLNRYYNYLKYPNKKVPMKELLSDFLFGVKYGIKTWYYTNTDEVENEDDGCAGGGCNI